MWDWLKSNRWVIGSGLVLAIATFVILKPQAPIFDHSKPYQQPNPSYQAGGVTCSSSYLARVTPAAAKQALADKCADEREVNRQAENNAHQNTRAAIAAEQGALETYWQALAAAVTAGLLVAALWASIFAGVAARDAAVAANKTLEHEQGRAERELRAYVFVHETKVGRTTIKLGPLTTIDGETEIKIPNGRVSYTLENTGKTPAKNVKVAARAVWIKSGDPVDVTAIGEFRFIGPLGPKSVFTDERDIDGRPSDFRQIKDLTADETHELHLFGRIEYEDEFSAGPPVQERWTTFHAYIGGPVRYDKTLHTIEPGNEYR